MSNNNRKAVTIRLNLADQQNLRSLAQFWGLSEQRALKMAFEQLVSATSQMQKKLQEQEKANAEVNNTGDGGTSDGAGDVPDPDVSNGHDSAGPADSTDSAQPAADN